MRGNEVVGRTWAGLEGRCGPIVTQADKREATAYRSGWWDGLVVGVVLASLAMVAGVVFVAKF